MTHDKIVAALSKAKLLKASDTAQLLSKIEQVVPKESPMYGGFYSAVHSRMFYSCYHAYSEYSKDKMSYASMCRDISQSASCMTEDAKECLFILLMAVGIPQATIHYVSDKKSIPSVGLALSQFANINCGGFGASNGHTVYMYENNSIKTIDNSASDTQESLLAADVYAIFLNYCDNKLYYTTFRDTSDRIGHLECLDLSWGTRQKIDIGIKSPYSPFYCHGGFLYYFSDTGTFNSYNLTDGSCKVLIDREITCLDLYDGCFYFVAKNDYCIYKMPVKGGQAQKLSDEKAYDLCVNQDYIFFTQYNSEDEDNELGAPIYRMSHDGKKPSPLCSKNARQLQIIGDCLFFIDAQAFHEEYDEYSNAGGYYGMLCSIDLDGNNHLNVDMSEADSYYSGGGMLFLRNYGDITRIV